MDDAFLYWCQRLTKYVQLEHTSTLGCVEEAIRKILSNPEKYNEANEVLANVPEFTKHFIILQKI